MRANNCNNCEWSCWYITGTSEGAALPCCTCECFSEWKPAVCECCKGTNALVVQASPEK